MSKVMDCARCGHSLDETQPYLEQCGCCYSHHACCSSRPAPPPHSVPEPNTDVRAPPTTGNRATLATASRDCGVQVFNFNWKSNEENYHECESNIL